MEISEIVDEESLEAWLKEKPAEWAQVIAARVALRVAPLAWSLAAVSDEELAEERRLKLTVLTLRANFISSAARIYPAEDMNAAASSAAYAAYVAYAAYATRASAASASAYATRASAASAPPPPQRCGGALGLIVSGWKLSLVAIRCMLQRMRKP